MPGETTEKIITTTTTEEMINQKQPQQQGFVVTTNIQPAQISPVEVQTGLPLQMQMNQVTVDEKLIKRVDNIHQQALGDQEKQRQKDLDLQKKQVLKEEKLYEKGQKGIEKQQIKDEKNRLKEEKNLLKEQQKQQKDLEKKQIKSNQGLTTTIDPMLAAQQVLIQPQLFTGEKTIVTDEFIQSSYPVQTNTLNQFAPQSQQIMVEEIQPQVYQNTFQSDSVAQNIGFIDNNQRLQNQ